MDNIEIIIYIVISIGWFLLQARKKRKLKETASSSPNPTAGKSIPSLEEQEELLEPERSLLKELLGEPLVESNSNPQPQPHVFSAEEEHESIEELAEEVRRKKKEKQKRREPFQQYSRIIKEDSEEEHPVKAWLFEDEVGPQKAIILSEILNRKEY